MNRTRIGELRAGVPAALIAGRVIATSAGAFRLSDESGALELRLPDAARPPQVGDLVRVHGVLARDGSFAAQRIDFVGHMRLRAGESPEWADPKWATKRHELAARDRLLRALRRYFHDEGFLEVETPALLRAPGQEPHLSPFATAFHGSPQERSQGAGATLLWLATSPEYAMKRLLALGCERIFQLGRSFRDGRDERSPLHSPEFTLLEWYRAWAGLGAIGRDVESILRAAAAELAGVTELKRAARSCDAARPALWLSVEQAFREFADVDLEAYLDGDDAMFVASLPASFRRIDGSAREQADSAYFRLMIEKIEPELGVGRPTFLCRYPARHAALSELCADDPRVAERFEVYVLGVELANAFLELRDPDEQERRLREEQAERVRAGGSPLPICDDFLRALRGGLPPCAGIALGVDRLHLVAAGAARLDDVIPFPFPESA